MINKDFRILQGMLVSNANNQGGGITPEQVKTIADEEITKKLKDNTVALGGVDTTRIELGIENEMGSITLLRDDEKTVAMYGDIYINDLSLDELVWNNVDNYLSNNTTLNIGKDLATFKLNTHTGSMALNAYELNINTDNFYINKELYQKPKKWQLIASYTYQLINIDPKTGNLTNGLYFYNDKTLGENLPELTVDNIRDNEYTLKIYSSHPYVQITDIPSKEFRLNAEPQDSSFALCFANKSEAWPQICELETKGNLWNGVSMMWSTENKTYIPLVYSSTSKRLEVPNDVVITNVNLTDNVLAWDVSNNTVIKPGATDTLSLTFEIWGYK